jgi:hypothetical protein
MPSPERFVGLVHLFDGYFHQDWMEESGSPEEAVHRFAYSEAPHLVSLALADLRSLLATPATEATLQRMLDAWGCEYYLPEDGLSAREWLLRVQHWLTPPVSDPEYQLDEEFPAWRASS